MPYKNPAHKLANEAARRTARKRQGVCVWCGKKPPRKNQKLCEVCGDQGKLNSKARRKRLLIDQLCTKCEIREALPDGTRCTVCREEHRLYSTQRYYRIRAEVFEAYGNICNCCGEANTAFLTLDHVNNDGSIDRLVNRKLSVLEKVWKRHREDIQLLCYNCNLGKAKNGGICPHVQEKVIRAVNT